MAVYAVGDIQGCYKALKKLLKKASFDAEKDVLWCVGDMVNRGPESLKTLRFLKNLGDACVCVLGNHDLHLLERAAGGRKYRRDTLDDVLEAPDCEDLLDWLRHRPLLHHDARLGWAMVHAGLHPKWSLKKAKKRARRVENALRSDDWREFCLHLHHSEFPKREPAREDKAGRRLFAAAVLTRVRYCTSSGRFNWDVRSGNARSKREKPWFSFRRLAWERDCRIVYGHWAAKGLVLDQPHVLGLDSGYVWGGELTLVRLMKNGKFRMAAQVRH